MTTARWLYRSYLFVAGVTLIVLGCGNYLAAAFKVEHYQETMAEVAPEIRPTASFLPHEELHYSLSDARERWEIARAKLDFYYVVLSIGRLMISIGTVCTVIALIRLRRQGIRLARTLAASSGGREG
ncbi:MAG: hypothetical protein HY268_22755 [Deltaproteobacteria bacterium]|nr:hypothetical protein [Deltaproteobacteria bacterium]